MFTACGRRKADLATVARSVNEKCPRLIDSETRIDGVAFVPPDTLRYVYTLVNISPGVADTSEFRKALWPGLLAHIRIARDLSPLRKDRVIFQYVYHYRNGGHLYTFNVSPRHYETVN
jgi:hypothetical protein